MDGQSARAAGGARQTGSDQLAIIKEEERYGDLVDWLTKELSISYPGKAEIMQVSLTLKDRNEAATLVNAVVDSYLTEVVNNEREQKQQRLNQLELAFTKNQTEVRSKRDDLKRLALRLGASETETLTLQQKFLIEDLSFYKQELSKVQGDLRRLHSDLAAQKAVLNSVENVATTDGEVDMLVQNDPVARPLFVELGTQRMYQLYVENNVVAGAKSPYVTRYQQELKTLQDRFDARRAELAETVKEKKRSTVQIEIQRLLSSITVIKEQEESLTTQVATKQAETKQFGGVSVDVAMMQSDIKNLDIVVATLQNERDKLKVEVSSAPRISRMGGPVEAPEFPPTACRASC